MKKRIIIFGLVAFGCGLFPHTSFAAGSLEENLSGKIVLQVEQNGEAWYIDPSDKKRHSLGWPADAFAVMRERGVGISDEDLEKIPTDSDSWNALPQVLKYTKGKILLQVEQHGEAWYVNPSNGKRYYLGRPHDALKIMRNLGLGITKENLRKIEFGSGPVEKVVLSVPFIAQAPTGDWNLPFEEACEETSLIMVDAFYKNKKSIDRFEARDRIRELVEYQNARFGFYDDTSMKDTGVIAQEEFGMHSLTETNVTKEAIKRHITEGNPVIFPVAGKNLGNPRYKGEGPPYHVIVIVGFDDDQFVVHDPGTRYGAFNRYHMDHLLRENHDLTVSQDEIKKGARGMLVVTQL